MKPLQCLLVTLLAAGSACTNPGKDPDAYPATVTAKCYRYTSDQDTVSLLLSGPADNITGQLVYQIHEKDRNTGTFNGSIVDGKLFALYTFMSEGVESKRPLAFKLDGDNLVEGYGETVTENGLTTFADPDAVSFDKGIVLRPVDCNNK
jgi:hypothetical protein